MNEAYLDCKRTGKALEHELTHKCCACAYIAGNSFYTHQDLDILAQALGAERYSRILTSLYDEIKETFCCSTSCSSEIYERHWSNRVITPSLMVMCASCDVINSFSVESSQRARAAAWTRIKIIDGLGLPCSRGPSCCLIANEEEACLVSAFYRKRAIPAIEQEKDDLELAKSFTQVLSEDNEFLARRVLYLEEEIKKSRSPEILLGKG